MLRCAETRMDSNICPALSIHFASFVAAFRQKANASIWSAATCRRFPTARHVAQFQSADFSAHSKSWRYPAAKAVNHFNAAVCRRAATFISPSAAFPESLFPAPTFPASAC
jgi:hypothetical protein